MGLLSDIFIIEFNFFYNPVGLQQIMIPAVPSFVYDAFFIGIIFSDCFLYFFRYTILDNMTLNSYKMNNGTITNISEIISGGVMKIATRVSEK